MHELFGGAVGERLELADYQADFGQHFWDIGQVGFWKLERQQYFQEPGDGSWEAFARGDWDEALRLLEAARADLEAEHRKIAEHGFSVNRVRVVEEPINPYLHWELHLLRVREQSGTHVRIVGPGQVARFERDEPLPEIVVLGNLVMYEVLYDEHGIPAGGCRYRDPELITRWRQLTSDLFAIGEPLADYFNRCVAELPAPTVRHST